ncbi:MAG: chromosome segregation protein SMC [Gammaproteobacteria bacterium]
MRLKSIKLAGFKSFVDATTVPFVGNLSAVVGPNGCGKSNIIDAVRWVMGESSAKHLRGESMADVIFNGSTGRKPVSQASIELVFDNTEGRLGGEYAQYAEIAVKRQVTRDGQSNYSLNGTRCRRKDITQLFLGTGLGPRSYAIIEQGMISRLVEARPDDLRLFIEEAAGISKYKERRRETELRMRHTRDNLSRLEDLQEELTRQLDKLRQQSRAAQKYQAYRAEEREKRAQALAMRWRTAKSAHEKSEGQIREAMVALEALRTQRTRAESQGTQLRTHVQTQQAEVQNIQQRFYELGTELARIEQSLTHAKERQTQLNSDLARTDAELAESEQHEATDVEALAEAEAQFDDVAPEFEMASEALEVALDAQTEAEEVLREWQESWDRFTRDNYNLQQKAEVTQTQVRQLEDTLDSLQGRHDRLKLEKNALDTTELAVDVARLTAELTQLSADEQSLETQLTAETAALQEQRNQNNAMAAELDLVRQRIQEKVGRQSALSALQEAALGRDQAAVESWLQAVSLSEAPRLAEQLQVTAGWEQAVSVVLAEQLQAVVVSGSDAEQAALDAYANMPGGEVRLFHPTEDDHAEVHASKESHTAVEGVTGAPWPLLTAYVRGAGDWLTGVYAAPDWRSAWCERHRLLHGESVVTPDGIWMGRDWMVLRHVGATEDNVLVRQKALQELETGLAVDREQLDLLELSLSTGRERLQELEGVAADLREQLKGLHRQVGDVRSHHSAKQERLEQLTARRDRIEEEFLEIDAQTQTQHAALVERRQHLAAIVESMSESECQRETLKSRETVVREAHRNARDQVQQTRTRAHELELTHKTLRANIDATRTALMRLQGQLSVLRARRATLHEQLEEQAIPQDEVIERRDLLLDERLKVDEALQAAKEVLSTLEFELSTCDAQRQDADAALLTEQQGLESMRLQAETARLESQHLVQQLNEMDEDMPSVDAVLADLPNAASVEQGDEDLEQLKSRIARLGPSNLSAIDEYQAAEERQAYLNEQQTDVDSALATLEEAIRKIDKETRDRFKETFDVVNTGLQDLFPKVFGGGSAYLDLTGDDLLETGVAIMARPPGKRNSTIHLLSGGEKALTALALVFSIFRLNPAPFCMLDEVDAPLDDANVGRFCRLVQEMSTEVQFIYITHNKIAMEMAQNLMGVTMNEPGVSRLVAVDVEEAAALAAS